MSQKCIISLTQTTRGCMICSCLCDRTEALNDHKCNSPEIEFSQ